MEGRFAQGDRLTRQPSLEALGGRTIGCVMHATSSDGGRVRFVVAFDRPADMTNAESAAVARGRLQWFVSCWVGFGTLKEWRSREEFEPVLPIETCFLVDRMPNELHWCGTGDNDEQIDLVLCAKAFRMVLGLGWEGWADEPVSIFDLYATVADA